MSTLTLNNLVIKGVHGATGREHLDSQRFEVNIEIELDIEKASQTDSLSDTFDYKLAANIAREIIEGERCVLIEKLSSKIAERIASYREIEKVKVQIVKLDASSNGTPGIIVEKKRIPAENISPRL